MRVTLEFFGPIQDRIGAAELPMSLPAAPSSLESLVALLAAEREGAEHLLDDKLRVAVNDSVLMPGKPLSLKYGDRIAFLSPFSGG
ncbi:MoaD/ThiS family protein [Hyphobacterium sp.]|uniref:MoaD/ThiS family protein n=1 Tax=Hyphobacterium sp. TaxID=2004662 RepID=UPI003BAD43AD